MSDNPRLTENEAYYLRSILKMIEGQTSKIKHGPTLHSEIAYDNRDWLEMFIESHERVWTKAEVRHVLDRVADHGIGSYASLSETMEFFK